MWKIVGKDTEGRSREVRFIERPNTPRQLAGSLFRDVMRGETSEIFDREMESPEPLPGIDGIESWGARSAELFNAGAPVTDSLVYQLIGIGRTEQEAAPGLSFVRERELVAQALHRPETVVMDVSGLTEIEITAEETTGPVPSGERMAGSVFEARVYSNGAVMETEEESELETPSYRLRLSGEKGGIIARFAQWISRPFKSDQDPFMQSRLRHFEGLYSTIARNYPDIALAAPQKGQFRAIPKAPEGTAVIVFVHGTYSCAVPNLALLDPLKLPAYRFEHDTFLTLTENKNHLAQAVHDFIPKRARVYLVAHSRGGLVSRLAARDLTGDYDIRVMSYGTPHKGTPIANAGKRIFTTLLAGGRAALLAGGGAAAKATFGWDPPSIAGKLLMKGIIPSGFPPGLDAMRPESDLIGSLGSATELYTLRTWGAEYDIDKPSAGAFAFAIREAISAAFKGTPNDTVVSTASATAAGIPKKVLRPCTHFEYFLDKDVRDEIRRLS